MSADSTAYTYCGQPEPTRECERHGCLCGSEIAPVLTRLGSSRCHTCRGNPERWVLCRLSGRDSSLSASAQDSGPSGRAR